MDLPLTLERRRGGEAVLRDGAGRRFVLPVELVPGSGATVRVSAEPTPVADPPADGRRFLTNLLSRT